MFWLGNTVLKLLARTILTLNNIKHQIMYLKSPLETGVLEELLNAKNTLSSNTVSYDVNFIFVKSLIVHRLKEQLPLTIWSGSL